MRDDESNWFAKWDEDLPSPDELISLTQTLITPDLAMAFDIRNPTSPRRRHHHHQVRLQPPPSRLPPQDTPSSQPNSSGEFESSGGGGGGGGGGGAGSGEAGGEEEPARTLKRPRLVWTPQLHKRFVEAVAHLGIKNAVPKTIMQIMSVDGLTRENVASHLQKYRLYLKRMQQGISSGSGASNSIGSGAAFGPGTDTDSLFASSPVPAHFLHPGRPNSNQFLPFVSVTAMPHHHQMAIGSQQIQHHIRHFGTSPPDGQFDHPFLSRQSQSHVQIMGAPVHNNSSVMGSYHKDMGSVRETGDGIGRRALTLFPNGDD